MWKNILWGTCSEKAQLQWSRGKGTQLLSKTFQSWYQWDLHKAEHSKEKYCCESCGKLFLSSLSSQSATPQARAYHFDACGKGFRLSTSLKDHMTLQTGQKPFVCGLWARVTVEQASSKHICPYQRETDCLWRMRQVFSSRTLLKDKTMHTGQEPVSNSCGMLPGCKCSQMTCGLHPYQKKRLPVCLWSLWCNQAQIARSYILVRTIFCL